MLKSDQLIHRKLSVINQKIIATLAYFDLFDYPLTQGEIFLFLTERYELKEFNMALEYLRLSGLIFRFDRFYALKNEAYLAERRRAGNAKAEQMIEAAGRVGKILIRFPFVRGIAISGSLSKNYADEQSDIDLFIITSANRLWIARTILHLFKKFTFLLRLEHFFCMNYFIDEHELNIAEKNIYTAIEIATLMPLEGDTVLEGFYAANAWFRDYLPNNVMRVSRARPVKNYLFKQLAEACFHNKAAAVLERKLMEITTARWLKKTRLSKRNSKGAVMGMCTGKHFAKPDPGNFQGKLIDRYESRLLCLLKAYENQLTD